jgi:hypothetical protein
MKEIVEDLIFVTGEVYTPRPLNLSYAKLSHMP